MSWNHIARSVDASKRKCSRFLAWKSAGESVKLHRSRFLLSRCLLSPFVFVSNFKELKRFVCCGFLLISLLAGWFNWSKKPVSLHKEFTESFLRRKKISWAWNVLKAVEVCLNDVFKRGSVESSVPSLTILKIDPFQLGFATNAQILSCV